MDFILGKGSKTKKKPIYDQDQQDILNQLLGGISGPLTSGLQNLQNILGGDQGFFDRFQAPARRDFQQETLPSIAERFTGNMGEGSQQSSAFGQAMASAGKELEEDLFSQRIGMQSNALNQLLQMLSPALSPRRHRYTTNRQPGFLENVIMAYLSGSGPGSWGKSSGATGGAIDDATGGATGNATGDLKL